MISLILAGLGLVGLLTALFFANQWSQIGRNARVAMAVLVFIVFPGIWGLGVVVHDMNRMKTADFCGSCHVMDPYIFSMTVDDSESIPAIHFQNNWVDQKTACYSCHTQYTMFGGVKGKMNGLAHVYVNYIKGPPEDIQLYEPYQNRDCLHCHGPSKRFKEGETHEVEMDAILSGETSCLEAGCHDIGHITEEEEDW